MNKLEHSYIELADRFSKGLTAEDYLQWNTLINTKNEFIEYFDTKISDYSFNEFVESEISSLSGKIYPSGKLIEISNNYSVNTRLEILMFLIIDEQIPLSYDNLNTIEKVISKEKKESYSLLYKFIDLICQNEYYQYASEIERLLQLLPQEYIDETILLQVEAFRKNG